MYVHSTIHPVPNSAIACELVVNHCRISLIPGLFPPPVFDHLQYAKMMGGGGDKVTCMTSGGHEILSSRCPEVRTELERFQLVNPKLGTVPKLSLHWNLHVTALAGHPCPQPNHLHQWLTDVSWHKRVVYIQWTEGTRNCPTHAQFQV